MSISQFEKLKIRTFIILTASFVLLLAMIVVMVYLRDYIGNGKKKADAELPRCLSKYETPAELGDDIFSGNISIDGDLYRLPAPLSQFLDNGWVLDKEISLIKPGWSEFLEIERNGKKLYIAVSNLATYKTSTLNCAVYRFRSATCPIIFPRGLELGVTEEYEFDLKVGSLFTFEGKAYFNGYEHYWYRFLDPKDNSRLDMQFFFNADNSTLGGIEYSTSRWDY